ncbi:hypothetical protein JCM11641_001624 [Rhodosporidiobolus odoratus]
MEDLYSSKVKTIIATERLAKLHLDDGKEEKKDGIHVGESENQGKAPAQGKPVTGGGGAGGAAPRRVDPPPPRSSSSSSETGYTQYGAQPSSSYCQPGDTERSDDLLAHLEILSRRLSDKDQQIMILQGRVKVLEENYDQALLEKAVAESGLVEEKERMENKLKRVEEKWSRVVEQGRGETGEGE